MPPLPGQFRQFLLHAFRHLQRLVRRERRGLIELIHPTQKIRQVAERQNFHQRRRGSVA